MIKIRKLDPNSPQSLGNLQITFGNKDQGLLHFYNQWEQFYFWKKELKWNWYTFTFFHCEIENDKMVPGYEVEFILLGFGFRFRWNRDWEKEETESTRALKDITERMALTFAWQNKKTKKSAQKEYDRLVKKLKEIKKKNLARLAE